jgi:hypothetical protein
MSEREELQVRLGCWIENWATAPYGVIPSMYTPASGRGKARVITFGLAATLDATVTIWSATQLYLRSSRGDDQMFKSEQEFRDHCVANYGAPA